VDLKELSRRPLEISETRVWRFYKGGRLIDEFRGRSAPRDTEFPEDWIASVTPAMNPGRDEPEAGLSKVILEAGESVLLRDLLRADPAAFLGSDFSRRFEGSPGLLVKLLDPAERLPVHSHPTRRFAKDIFGSTFGKTEAWVILGVREDQPKPGVWLGLKEDLGQEGYLELVEQQDTDAMLEALHFLAVSEGDVIFVPAGIPHAIGRGKTLALPAGLGQAQVTGARSILFLGPVL
jgi:mannose-6-phosphate isomerase